MKQVEIELENIKCKLRYCGEKQQLHHIVKEVTEGENTVNNTDKKKHWIPCEYKGIL